MNIVNQSAIERFIKKHPQSRPAMQFWLAIASNAKWAHGSEVVRDFPKANFKNNLWIFNVGGNTYRLTATIIFSEKLVAIDKVMTHAEYDKETF